MAGGGGEHGGPVLAVLAPCRRPGAAAVVPVQRDAAVRLGARRLRDRGGADRRHDPADLDPDRVVPQRQRDRRAGERRLRAVLRHGGHHRGSHGLLRAVPAEGVEMAAVTTERTPAPAPAADRPRRRGQAPVWRWVILLIAGLYFLLPLFAALRFAGLKAFGTVFTSPGFVPALWLSVRLAAVTWIVSMALMIPTTVYVHLRMPAMRRLLESVTILPIVIPPVVLIIGVLQVMPLALRASVWMLGLEYVILAMPFAYRALDAGLRSIDVKTLTEASNSLGGGMA